MSKLEEDFKKKVEADAALREKEYAVKKNRIDSQYDQLQHNQKELERYSQLNFDKPDIKRIRRIQQDNDEYMKNARNCMIFLNNDFRQIVPFFAKNLIFIGAKTGEGKSTVAANIAMKTISQGKRVLVITNEENTEDMYNRVTCLLQGWDYKNHDRFSDNQIQIFREYIEKLSHRMTVIDSSFAGGLDLTTSIDGIEGILTGLLRSEVKYDVVILDYYQNVSSSNKNPRAEPWQVQEQLARLLDGFKNTYPAPIIVLGQLMPSNKDNKDFKHRVEGRKAILNPATCVLEVKADRENCRSEWIIHKSRYKTHENTSILTGYSKGKYVQYSSEFQKDAMRRREAMEQADLLKTNNTIEEENGNE